MITRYYNKQYVRVSKDDDTLHAYLIQGYKLESALAKCLFKVGIFTEVGNFDVLELKKSYKIKLHKRGK